MLQRLSPSFIIKLIAIMALGFYLGCSKPSSSTIGSTPAEATPYCSTVSTYNNGINVSGSAQYYFRTNGNGAVTTSPNPIRYAEVRVYDSSGTTLQCGSTDSAGNFSLSLPQNNAAVTIEVNSRASGTNVNAYILKSPYSNAHYSITKSVTLDSAKNVGAISALATGSLEGGAFNILDKILDANIFLRSSTAGCSSIGSDCVAFTVAPQVTVYWAPGVNPGDYFGYFGGISFYAPGESKLYVLGGSSGDVDHSDTDHFDNSVVIHEYGHFVEDIYAKTDSPGGSHGGDSILDPRLAWSEGFADFFQAAVLGNAIYRDTMGNVDGTTSVLLNIDLETGATDLPTSMGEGNFREFSITRALWDLNDTANEGGSVDDVSSAFNKIWYLMTSETIGFRSSSFHFRNLGLLYQQHATLPSPNEWNTIMNAEKERPNQNDYARSLAAGTCAATTIQAVSISSGTPENGTYANSNQFASNDFYQYYHAGGTLTINLSYTTTAGNPANLDLILYPEDYSFGQNNPTGASKNTISVGQGSGTEVISGTIPAGYYMIAINVNTQSGLGSAANYQLQINGAGVCPQ